MAKYRIIKPKNHDEWLKHRLAGIGSSDVGTIIGVNPYETPYQLWARRKGILPNKEENFLMKAGHYLEDAVSRFYADATGADIVKSSAGDWLVVDTEHDWRRVSPDRFYYPEGMKRSAKNKCILECKTTQMNIDIDALPRYWFCQLQYQLGVCGLEHGALAWLTQGRDFGYKEIDFNQDFFDWMMEVVDDFFIRYIQGDEEPPVSNVEDVKIKFPNSIAGKSVEVDKEVTFENEQGEHVTMSVREVCMKLREATDYANKFGKMKEHYQDVLKGYMCDAEYLVDDEKKVVASWKNNSTTRKFDSKRFAKDYPETFQMYSTEVTGARVFRFK